MRGGNRDRAVTRETYRKKRSWTMLRRLPALTIPATGTASTLSSASCTLDVRHTGGIMGLRDVRL
jgi:hypothetical protein